jgi:protein TonB
MVENTLGWVRERPLAAAILVSIAIHAMALTLFPQLRALKREVQNPLQVEILPQARESAPSLLQPAASEAVPEARPAALPPPERPRIKAVKPLPTVPAREPAPITAPSAPRQEILTASPEAPPQSSQFSVPAAPERVEGPPPPVRDSEVTASPDPDLLAGYGHALSQAIGKHQRYPRIAQMRGWQGTATIALKFGSGHRLLAATVHKSSGHEVLDEQALEMVKDAHPLPNPPERLRNRDFTVLVPIVFRLKD